MIILFKEKVKHTISTNQDNSQSKNSTFGQNIFEGELKTFKYGVTYWKSLSKWTVEW